MTTSTPEGFELFAGNVGFLETAGPFMVKMVDGQARLGLRIEAKHCNIADICHGGMLMTFADMQLAIGGQAIIKVKKFLPTIHMSCDFAAPAPLGAWLEGETEVTRQTRKMLFATCKLMADGELVFSGSGIMKIPSDNDPKYAKIKLPGKH